MSALLSAKNEVLKYDAVIITGASSGIGEAFARFVVDAFEAERGGASASAGANSGADDGFGAEARPVRVFNISRSPTQFESCPIFESVECDLTDRDALGRAAERIKSRLCDLSKALLRAPKILLVNNSGFGAYGAFPKPELRRNLDMVSLNVSAVVALCGLFLPEIVAGRGGIINVASTAAFQACPQLSVYAATKAFVKSFSMSLSDELREEGCKCLCVCPGPTSSMFFKSAGFESAPLPKWYGHKPEDVALAAFAALSRDAEFVVVGLLNRVQTLLVRLLPERILLRVSGAVLRRLRRLD